MRLLLHWHASICARALHCTTFKWASCHPSGIPTCRFNIWLTLLDMNFELLALKESSPWTELHNTAALLSVGWKVLNYIAFDTDSSPCENRCFHSSYWWKALAVMSLIVCSICMTFKHYSCAWLTAVINAIGNIVLIWRRHRQLLSPYPSWPILL